MRLRTSNHRSVLSVVALSSIALLTACSSESATPSNETASATLAPAEVAAVEFPLTIDNCGHSLHFEQTPAFSYVDDITTVDILQALGLEAALTSRSDYKGTPTKDPEIVFTRNGPGYSEPTYFSAVEPLAPQLFVGTVFTDPETIVTGDFDTYANAGIPAYLNPTFCDLSKPFDINDLYQHIRDFAALYQVPAQGEQVVNELRTRWDSLDNPTGRELSFVVVDWIDNGDSVYLEGPNGSFSGAAERLGMHRAMDVRETTLAELAAANPDVIIVPDFDDFRTPGDTAHEIIMDLQNHPQVGLIDAAQEARFIIIPTIEQLSAFRVVDAAEKMQEALARIGDR